MVVFMGAVFDGKGIYLVRRVGERLKSRGGDGDGDVLLAREEIWISRLGVCVYTARQKGPLAEICRANQLRYCTSSGVEVDDDDVGTEAGDCSVQLDGMSTTRDTLHA